MNARGLCLIVLMAALLVCCAAAAADDCQGDVFDCATTLLDQGQARQAINLLKPALAVDPDDGTLARLLAASYLAEGNRFWALRTLNEHLAHTGDAQSACWIAWLQIQDAQLDQARDALDAAALADEGPLRARTLLLRAMLNRLAGEDEPALDNLRSARKAKRMYQEDRDLLDYLRSLDRGWIVPLVLTLEAGGGWESNALQSSVAEDQQDEVESAFVALRHDARLTWPLHRLLRPSAEYSLRLKAYTQPDADDAGYYVLNGRAGLIVGNAGARLGLYYANENTVLRGADVYDPGPRWYIEAHRGELEFEPWSWLLVFGGGGRRFFRERARTRFEYDLGAAIRAGLPAGLALSAVASGRVFNARIEAYDLLGGSLLIAPSWTYYRDGLLRVAVAGILDDYQSSEDYFEPDDARRDSMLRVAPALYSPSYKGLRLGLSYRYTDRHSTVERYSFVNHEARLSLSWRGEFNPWRPRRAKGLRHVPLDYGLTSDSGYQDDVRELLRQDDAARGSSSCVE
ncbi:MAG: tetratricopeptide repeat protein [Candidatus Alcyoniella australis]|nr:tetratricopeptide repeat protein [Candidatus Alcyoniella australis]